MEFTSSRNIFAYDFHLSPGVDLIPSNIGGISSAVANLSREICSLVGYQARVSI